MLTALQWFLRLGVTNPICVRLVQGGSRRTRHLTLRTGYLALLILVLLWVLLMDASGSQLSYAQLAKAGATSFKWTAYLQIALICILSPIFMSGAIAQEANPQTWDILLTTPLSAVQLVLGNLLGRLFFVMALLVASLPLFAITQYFGGAPGASIFASYAVAMGAALLVGAIAITLSVSRVAGKRSVFTFYVSVVSYLAATWAIDVWLRGSPGSVTALTPLNPFLALQSMLNPSSYSRPEAIELGAMSTIARLWFGSPVLTWCLLSAGLSALLVLVSTLMVRRVGASTESELKKRLSRLTPWSGRTRAPRHVWRNPIAWREAVTRGGTPARLFARWSFVAAGLLWALGLLAFYHSGELTHSELRFALLATVWTETAVIALVAMNMAGATVSREREDGTLDLLLITPIEASAYLRGKLRGLISFLTPMIAVPVVTMALASLYVLAGGFGRTGGVISTDSVGLAQVKLPVILPDAAIVAPLVIVPFIAFCVTVGLQWSLKSKGAISSVIATVGVVVVLSGIVGACGWKAGQDIAVVGPVIACLNPATAIYAVVNPAVAAEQTVEMSNGGLSELHLSLLVGAVIAMLIYSALVYAMHVSMVRTFDMTVRRLAGQS